MDRQPSFLSTLYLNYEAGLQDYSFFFQRQHPDLPKIYSGLLVLSINKIIPSYSDGISFFSQGGINSEVFQIPVRFDLNL